MRRFGRCFRRLLEDYNVLYKSLNDLNFHRKFANLVAPPANSSYIVRCRYKIRKFVVEIFQNVKIRPQSCAKYFEYLLFTL